MKYIAVAGCLLVLCIFFARYVAMSEDTVFLGDKHVKEYGLECSTCHTEVPPSKSPATKICIRCHGNLLDVGKNTELNELPNPHINHNEELYCDDCHKGHKESVNFCDQCHDFKYRIP